MSEQLTIEDINPISRLRFRKHLMEVVLPDFRTPEFDEELLEQLFNQYADELCLAKARGDGPELLFSILNQCSKHLPEAN